MQYRWVALAASLALLAGCGGGAGSSIPSGGGRTTQGTNSNASQTAQSIDVQVNEADLVETGDATYKYNLTEAEAQYTIALANGGSASCTTGSGVNLAPAPCPTSTALPTPVPATSSSLWSDKGVTDTNPVNYGANTVAASSKLSDAISDNQYCAYWNGTPLDSFQFTDQAGSVTTGSGHTKVTYAVSYTYDVTPNGTPAAHTAYDLLNSTTTGASSFTIDGYIAGESVVYAQNSNNNKSYSYKLSFDMGSSASPRVQNLLAQVYPASQCTNPADATTCSGTPAYVASQTGLDPSGNPVDLLTVGLDSNAGLDLQKHPDNTFNYVINAGKNTGANGTMSLLSNYCGDTTFEALAAEGLGTAPIGSVAGNVTDCSGTQVFDDFAGNDNQPVPAATFSSPTFTPSGDANNNYVGLLTGTVKGNGASLTFTSTVHYTIHLVKTDGTIDC